MTDENKRRQQGNANNCPLDKKAMKLMNEQDYDRQREEKKLVSTRTRCRKVRDKLT